MKKVSIPSSFFKDNRNKLVALIRKGSVALISANHELTRTGDQSYPYRQNSDLFYLTGIDQKDTILALCPDHPDPSLREVIFTTRPDPLSAVWTGESLIPSQVKAISGISSVRFTDQMELVLREIILASETIYLNQNEYVKYLPELEYGDKQFINTIKTQFPLHHYKRLAPILTQLRIVKEPLEIELMSESCRITEEAFRSVTAFLEPGVTEYQVEAEMVYTFLRNGARGPAYQPIVASGKNALVLHYIENSKTCKDGELLLMDFGAEYGNYAADCSRTIPVNGHFTSRQRACYESVLRVQKEALKLFVPGNTIDIVNKKVWKMMEEEMIGLGLFSKTDVDRQDPSKPLYSKYLMHGVTHFIGLDVHDVGSKFVPFQAGMVLTLEPGLYIPEEGIGIRIEDNIVVDNPPKNLTKKIPKEIGELEQMMKR